jgi:hypothetical protein
VADHEEEEEGEGRVCARWEERAGEAAARRSGRFEA